MMMNDDHPILTLWFMIPPSYKVYQPNTSKYLVHPRNGILLPFSTRMLDGAKDSERAHHVATSIASKPDRLHSHVVKHFAIRNPAKDISGTIFTIWRWILDEISPEVDLIGWLPNKDFQAARGLQAGPSFAELLQRTLSSKPSLYSGFARRYSAPCVTTKRPNSRLSVATSAKGNAARWGSKVVNGGVIKMVNGNHRGQSLRNPSQ